MGIFPKMSCYFLNIQNILNIQTKECAWTCNYTFVDSCFINQRVTMCQGFSLDWYFLSNSFHVLCVLFFYLICVLEKCWLWHPGWYLDLVQDQSQWEKWAKYGRGLHIFFIVVFYFVANLDHGKYISAHQLKRNSPDIWPFPVDFPAMIIQRSNTYIFSNKECQHILIIQILVHHKKHLVRVEADLSMWRLQVIEVINRSCQRIKHIYTTSMTKCTFPCA